MTQNDVVTMPMIPTTNATTIAMMVDVGRLDDESDVTSLRRQRPTHIPLFIVFPPLDSPVVAPVVYGSCATMILV